MIGKKSSFFPRFKLKGRRVEETLDDFSRPISITNTEFDVLDCTIQPVTGNDLLALGEGFRTKSVYAIFTSTLIFEGDNTNRKPDEIEIYSKWYRVARVEIWQNGVASHYKCICVEKDLGLL